MIDLFKMSANRNMSNKSNKQNQKFSRGGRGRGRGRGRGGGRRYNNMRYNNRNREPMRKVPTKPLTPMEKLRATNMQAYVRVIQSKRIADMEEKYIEDACPSNVDEKPKLPYLPVSFNTKGNFPKGENVRKYLGDLGWNYHNGEFLHPYTTATIHTVHEQACDGGRILVPGYDVYMDKDGVSSNIMNVDNMPQYFSENTYVTRVHPGGSMTYELEQHKFSDFWNTRRGKRTEKNYLYVERRKKRREEFVNMKLVEEKKQKEYNEAKKILRK